MKTQNKIIIGLIVLLLLMLGGGALYINSLKGEIDDLEMANRKLVLKNDTLQKVSDTQYRKLVADTLTKRQLQKKVDSLGLELDAKPKVIYKVKFVPKEVEKPTDSVSVDSLGVTIDDYYPKRDNYFVRYQNRISLKDSTGVSKWSFGSISISGVISQRDDGIFQADFKTPEWLTIEDVDIQAVPLEVPKPDNFGLLLGGSVGKDFKSDEVYGRISGGLRFKKFYIDIGAGTNQTLDGGIKFEF